MHLVMFLCAVCGVATPVFGRAQTGSEVVSQLHAESVPMPEWMTGQWIVIDGNRWFREFWGEASSQAMVGAGKSGQGSDTGEWEVMVILRDGESGRPAFLVRPNGRDTVTFDMVASGEAMIEFANPAHDFPQRIRYWRNGDALIAEISMMDGSRMQRWEYRRAEAP